MLTTNEKVTTTNNFIKMYNVCDEDTQQELYLVALQTRFENDEQLKIALFDKLTRINQTWQHIPSGLLINIQRKNIRRQDMASMLDAGIAVEILSSFII